MTELADHLIIERVLQGQQSLYAVLVERYKTMAFTLAYNIILNREDAEEIAQDAFVKAYTSLRSFKQNAKFSTWLYRIIINTAINKKRLKKLNLVLEDDTCENVTAVSEQVYCYPGKEQRKYIQLAMADLKENERLCITLYYLNELLIEEISTLTGITSSNIKVLLFRGRKKIYSTLKRLLNEEMGNLI